MNNYKYDVQYSNQFKKGLKKSLKQGKDIDKLLDIVDKLANMEKLEQKFKNHKLVNDEYYIDCFECYIDPDWLLIYKYNENEFDKQANLVCFFYASMRYNCKLKVNNVDLLFRV